MKELAIILVLLSPIAIFLAWDKFRKRKGRTP